MKTKLWLVIWGLKDGGAETLAREYARLIDPQKFDATIVTLYPFENTANYRHAQEAGLRVASIFKRRNVITRAIRVLCNQWYIPLALKRMLAKEKPDTIHFNSAMAWYFVPLRKELSHAKLLYTCHSEPDKHFFEKEEKAVRLLIRENGLRLIALHEDMKQELNKRFGVDNTAVIKNGVELDSFRRPGKDRSATLQSIGIPQEAFVVGHVGRFAEEKNHKFLLRVFQEIASRKPNAHLLLVGSGELQNAVEQEIKEKQLESHVTILSHRSDIPDLLHAMDVMVFPSFYEGFSVTLVEAQAAGLKCVVSDAVNRSNFLSEKTIPMSLKASAAQWAETALDDTVKNETYGCLEDYDMNREIRNLERLYQVGETSGNETMDVRV